MQMPSLFEISLAAASRDLTRNQRSVVLSQLRSLPGEFIHQMLSGLSSRRQLSSVLLMQFLSTREVQCLDLSQSLLCVTGELFSRKIPNANHVFGRLEVIDLSYSHIDVVEVCSSVVGPYCHLLTELCLSATSITDGGLKTVCRHCPLLKKLQASQTRITGDFLPVLSESCASLSTLHLQDCPALNDQFMLPLLQLLPQLVDLDVSYVFQAWGWFFQWAPAMEKGRGYTTGLVRMTAINFNQVPIGNVGFCAVVAGCPLLTTLLADSVVWEVEETEEEGTKRAQWLSERLDGRQLLLQELAVSTHTCIRSGLLAHCPALQSLRLGLPPEDGDHAARAEVRKVEGRDCVLEVLELLARKAPSLNSLALCGDGVPQQAVELIAKRFACLRALEISVTPVIVSARNQVYSVDALGRMQSLLVLDFSETYVRFGSMEVVLPMLQSLRVLKAARSRIACTPCAWRTPRAVGERAEEGGAGECAKQKSMPMGASSLECNLDSMLLSSTSLRMLDLTCAVLLTDAVSTDMERAESKPAVHVRVRCPNIRTVLLDGLRAQALSDEFLCVGLAVTFATEVPWLTNLRTATASREGKLIDLSSLPPRCLTSLSLSGPRDFVRSDVESRFERLQVLTISLSTCTCHDLADIAAVCVSLHELCLSHCSLLVGVLAQPSTHRKKMRLAASPSTPSGNQEAKEGDQHELSRGQRMNHGEVAEDGNAGAVGGTNEGGGAAGGVGAGSGTAGEEARGRRAPVVGFESRDQVHELLEGLQLGEQQVFASTLTSEERRLVHPSTADRIGGGLEHESKGQGNRRRLVVSRSDPGATPTADPARGKDDEEGQLPRNLRHHTKVHVVGACSPCIRTLCAHSLYEHVCVHSLYSSTSSRCRFLERVASNSVSSTSVDFAPMQNAFLCTAR
jgi:hypothetical protein